MRRPGGAVREIVFALVIDARRHTRRRVGLVGLVCAWVRRDPLAHVDRTERGGGAIGANGGLVIVASSVLVRGHQRRRHRDEESC
jgi:hypothetical protein